MREVHVSEQDMVTSHIMEKTNCKVETTEQLLVDTKESIETRLWFCGTEISFFWVCVSDDSLFELILNSYRIEDVNNPFDAIQKHRDRIKAVRALAKDIPTPG